MQATNTRPASTWLRRALAVVWAAGVCLAPWAGRAIAQTTAAAVQVGANYGPGRSTMISGCIVGDGEFVLTDASVVAGAREFAIAFGQRDVFEAAVERIDEATNLALLKLSQRVQVNVDVLATMPPGDVTAVAIGSPEAFVTRRLPVRLSPAALPNRWKITPQPPPWMRGAPLVSASGTLLGLIVTGDGELVAVPSAAFGSMVAAGAGIADVPARAAVERRAAPSTPPGAVPPMPAPPAARTPEPEEGPAAATAAASEKARPSASPLPRVSRPARKLEEPAALTAFDFAREAITVPEPLLLAADRPVLPPPAKEVVPTESSAPRTELETAAATPEPASTASPAAAPGTTPEAAATATAADPTASWEQLLKDQPGNVQLRFDYARALMKVWQLDRAVEVLDEARTMAPSNPEVYWELAFACWQQAAYKEDGTRRRSMDRGPVRKAIAAYKAFVALAPGDSRAPIARARAEMLTRAGRR